MINSLFDLCRSNGINLAVMNSFSGGGFFVLATGNGMTEAICECRGDDLEDVLTDAEVKISTYIRNKKEER